MFGKVQKGLVKKELGHQGVYCLEHRQSSWIICQRNFSDILQNLVQIAFKCQAVSHQPALELPRKVLNLLVTFLLVVHYLYFCAISPFGKSLLCKWIVRVAY